MHGTRIRQENWLDDTSRKMNDMKPQVLDKVQAVGMQKT